MINRAYSDKNFLIRYVAKKSYSVIFTSWDAFRGKKICHLGQVGTKTTHSALGKNAEKKCRNLH